MALSTFVCLSVVWVLGLTYFSFRCACIEAAYEPTGFIGAFAGTGWLRGSTAASRRYRSWALYWAALGIMLITLVTRALMVSG